MTMVIIVTIIIDGVMTNERERDQLSVKMLLNMSLFQLSVLRPYVSVRMTPVREIPCEKRSAILAPRKA